MSEYDWFVQFHTADLVNTPLRQALIHSSVVQRRLFSEKQASVAAFHVAAERCAVSTQYGPPEAMPVGHPVRAIAPLTSSFDPGEATPIPTFPLENEKFDNRAFASFASSMTACMSEDVIVCPDAARLRSRVVHAA